MIKLTGFEFKKFKVPKKSKLNRNSSIYSLGPCGFQITTQALIKMTNEMASYCAIFFEDGVLKTLYWQKLKTEVHTVANIGPIFL
jgi:hypothetical protein